MLTEVTPKLSNNLKATTKIPVEVASTPQLPPGYAGKDNSDH